VHKFNTIIPNLPADTSLFTVVLLLQPNDSQILLSSSGENIGVAVVETEDCVMRQQLPSSLLEN
jgi:hypothetical protein